MPVRRDHPRQRLRDLGVQPRRPHLHQGHAARGAGEAGAGRRPRPLRHAHPLLQVRLVAMANFLVWVVWCGAAFACIARALGVVTFKNPFFSALALIGNLASLAVLYLLLGGEFVAAGQVLVYGGAVMVMFLFVIAYLGDRTEEAPWAGGPSWQAIGTVLAAGAILVEVIVAIGLTTGGALSRSHNISRAFGS